MRAFVAGIGQMGTSWHEGGMFIGMHWVWWILWILTLAFLLWAFWRMAIDRRETHRRSEGRAEAEAALRERFARGEVDEEEFRKRMRILREIVP